MPGGTKAHPLGRNRRIRGLREVGRNESGNVDQHTGFGRLSRHGMIAHNALLLKNAAVDPRGPHTVSNFNKGGSRLAPPFRCTVIPAKAGIQLNNNMIQILPIGIHSLNQFQFPFSLPFLYLFLPLNR